MGTSENKEMVADMEVTNRLPSVDDWLFDAWRDAPLLNRIAVLAYLSRIKLREQSNKESENVG